MTELASKIKEEYCQDNIIKWTEKDTLVIYLNSLIQFNEFLWLNLYQFKNSIELDDIKNLIKLIEIKNKVKEDLLFRDINIDTIEKKLNILFQNNVKNKIQNNIQKKMDKELVVLQNNLTNLTNKNLPKIFDENDIKEEIAEINKKINEIKTKKKNIDDFVVIFNEKQQNSIYNIVCSLEEFKDKLIKKRNINYEEFIKLAKILGKDYLKLLHILFDYKKEQLNYLIMCDFNYELIMIDIKELEKDKDKKKAYNKYFNNHMETIIADFNDLDKYEDYTINYVNQDILNIIYINIVFPICWEIYNTLLQYLFEKYNSESLNKITTNDTNLVLKNLKLYLKNKIYEILDIKNPLKSYDSLELYRDIIINFFVDFTNKKLEDDDKKEMLKIIELYSNILQNISSKFYNDIKEYLVDIQKIIIFIKIYNLFKKYEI